MVTSWISSSSSFCFPSYNSLKSLINRIAPPSLHQTLSSPPPLSSHKTQDRIEPGLSPVRSSHGVSPLHGHHLCILSGIAGKVALKSVVQFSLKLPFRCSKCNINFVIFIIIIPIENGKIILLWQVPYI